MLFKTTDVNILRDLSAGQTSQAKLMELASKEAAILKHALKCKSYTPILLSVIVASVALLP